MDQPIIGGTVFVVYIALLLWAICGGGDDDERS